MIGAVGGVDNIDRASGFNTLDYYDRMFLHNIGNAAKPVPEIQETRNNQQDNQENSSYYSNRRSDSIVLTKNRETEVPKNPAPVLSNADFPEQKEKLDNIQLDWINYQNSQIAGKEKSFGKEEIGNVDGKVNKTSGANNGECVTCNNRKYVDVSDDESVSFQIPTEISPAQAEAKVRAHENEHVAHEKAKAAEEGNRIVNQSVTIKTDVCPECGATYVSGGETKTATVSDPNAEKMDANQGAGRDVGSLYGDKKKETDNVRNPYGDSVLGQKKETDNIRSPYGDSVLGQKKETNNIRSPYEHKEKDNANPYQQTHNIFEPEDKEQHNILGSQNTSVIFSPYQQKETDVFGFVQNKATVNILDPISSLRGILR